MKGLEEGFGLRWKDDENVNSQSHFYALERLDLGFVQDAIERVLKKKQESAKVTI